MSLLHYWDLFCHIDHATAIEVRMSIGTRELPGDVLWNNPDSKVNGANMGPIWGRQDLGGPHVGPMNLAIWDVLSCAKSL